MSNPIKDFRNFKHNRSNPIHHARANEAQVEVVIETESETLTCEMNTMQNTDESKLTALVRNAAENASNESVVEIEPAAPTGSSETTIEGVKAEMNNLAGAIKEALDNPTIATEEDTVEQAETISITSVTDRYKTLRRNAVVSNVVGNVASVAGIVLGAAANGRDVKRGAIIGGVLGGVSIGWIVASRRQKAIAKTQAQYFDEETYQIATENKTSDIVKGALGALGVGMVIGAFFIRKVKSAE